MNTPNKNQLALWLIVGGAPFAAVIALRSLAGVGGPQEAMAATDDAEDDAADQDAGDTEHPTTISRLWVVSSKEAPKLQSAVADQLKTWSTPLFAPDPDAPPPVPAETEEAPHASVQASAPSPAAQFTDMFKVTSLMTTRAGAVAVIDKKLHRVGDELAEGVVVDAIDLAARVVTLRTADGATFERRANR